MGTEAVKWEDETRDMERIPDEKTLAFEGDNSRSSTKNRKVRAFSHANLKVGHESV